MLRSRKKKKRQGKGSSRCSGIPKIGTFDCSFCFEIARLNWYTIDLTIMYQQIRPPAPGYMSGSVPPPRPMAYAPSMPQVIPGPGGYVPQPMMNPPRPMVPATNPTMIPGPMNPPMMQGPMNPSPYQSYPVPSAPVSAPVERVAEQ